MRMVARWSRAAPVRSSPAGMSNTTRKLMTQKRAKEPETPPEAPPQQGLDANGVVESLLTQLSDLHFKLAVSQSSNQKLQEQVEGLQELVANKVVEEA